MVSMNVCILNMKGNFNSALGTGTQRTSYELWRNIKPLSEKAGVKLDKVEVGAGKSLLSRKVSFTMLLPFRNFNKYDIVHLLIPVAFPPRKGGKTKILTTVNEFVLLKKGSIAYSKLGDPKVIQKNDPTSVAGRFVAMRIYNQIMSSDYLAVNSGQTKEEAVSLGYPREKIFIINHGVDERFLTKLKERKNRVFKVGFMGALNVRKNLCVAIEAFKKIKSRDIEFEIWGKPVLEYENLVNQAKDDNRIKFMGFAPEDKIVDIYDSFDVFVFPSLYEGFGLPILEAQTRGLPVVLYKEGKIPDEVKKYCFVAKDEADMARIIKELKEKGYDDKLRKRATEYARGFTRKKEAINTLKVYKQIYSLKK